MKPSKILRSIPFLILPLCLPCQAGTTVSSEAEIVAEAKTDEDWWSRAMAYAWVIAIEGDVGILGLSAPVDITMSDALDSLDMAFMGTFEAGFGRTSFGLDVIYVKATDNIPFALGSFSDFRFVQEQWTLTPFATYNILQTEMHRLDFYGGLRATLMDAELTGFLTAGGKVTRSGDVEIFDPLVGIRGKSKLTDKIVARYSGDIGGFGIDSDLNWQLFAGISYDWTESFSLGLGYRAMGIDFSEGSFKMDTVMHGPAVGLEYRW